MPSANKDYNSTPQGPLLCLLSFGPWLADAVVPLQVKHPVINLTGMQFLSMGRNQVVLQQTRQRIMLVASQATIHASL